MLVLIIILVVSKVMFYTRWKMFKSFNRQESKEVFKVYLLEQERIRRFYQDRMSRHLSGVPTSDDEEQVFG